MANLHRALFTAAPVVLDRNSKGLQQAVCFEMLHAISENVIFIMAITTKNKSIDQYFLVLKLKETIYLHQPQ